jgi:cell division protein FtsB
MSTLRKNDNIKRTLYSAPSLVILLILSFILLKGAIKVIHKEWASGDYVKSLTEKEVALVKRQQELEEGIGRLKTDQGIREEIRERFSVTEAGELVAIIVDDQKTSSSTQDLVAPWYKRFWFAIIGK